jgi:hypothetical protein
VDETTPARKPGKVGLVGLGIGVGSGNLLENRVLRPSISSRHRDHPWLSDPTVLAPHLPSGWATGLEWCSTKHRGRYGRPFPGRDYILFVTFCVILATLVLQGLSLPALIHRLGVVDDGLAHVEERTARLKANEAALAFLSEVDSRFSLELAERLRAEYNDRIRQLEVCENVGENCSDGLLAPSYQRLQQDALDVERHTIIRLRDEFVINDEVLRRIQADLDHAEARLRVRA